MKLQVMLKLSLNKEVRRIKISYNTFEKAPFDKYLAASLELRTRQLAGKSRQVATTEAFAYIDEITGSGSLNSHLKDLLSEADRLTDEELQKVLDDSIVSVLRMNNKNRYTYYPQLGVSEFQGKTYDGDMGDVADFAYLCGIKGEVVGTEFEDVSGLNKPEQYLVSFEENGKIRVRIASKFFDISEEDFREVLETDMPDTKDYQGEVHRSADGDDWRILTKSAYNNLADGDYFFDKRGDHCLIRNDSVRKTEIAEAHGLYIYREKKLSYAGNRELSNVVLTVMIKKDALTRYNTLSLANLLKEADDKIAQSFVNAYLMKKWDKDIAFAAVGLLRKGIVTGWSLQSLSAALWYAPSDSLNLFYKVSPRLGFRIEQLLKIDRDLLVPNDRAKVEEYINDINKKKTVILNITGEITAKGLREKAKRLKANDVTKRFSKLCNELIGHVDKGIDEVTAKEVDEWMKKALQLKELAENIEAMLAAND